MKDVLNVEQLFFEFVHHFIDNLKNLMSIVMDKDVDESCDKMMLFVVQKNLKKIHMYHLLEIFEQNHHVDDFLISYASPHWFLFCYRI